MSGKNTGAPSPDGLRAKLKGERPIRFQRYAFLSYAGELAKLTWTEPLPLLATTWQFGKLLSRHDYDINDLTVPGQRDTYESHVKKIAAGIRDMSPRPYLGTLTIALDPEYVEIETVEQLGENVWLSVVTVREGAPNPWIEDGQHRILSLGRVWSDVADATDGDDAAVRDYLERSSVEVTLLLEDNPDILSTIFVKMASTKPISPSLIAVMDKENMQNRLGQFVIRNSRLLKDRVAYLSTQAHKKRGDDRFDVLYPAAAVRSAVAAIAGVGVRDRTPEQRESILTGIVAQRAARDRVSGEQALEMLGKEIVTLLDYAYEHVPGWREISKNRLSVTEFRSRYLHSSAPGLHIIANVIAAAQAAGVSAYAAIDALADIPWERDALRDIKDEHGEPAMAHKFFEGNLAKTVWDERQGEWRTSASGATRSGYEAAIDRVLRHIAARNPELGPLADRETYVKIGLIADKPGPGRPRKTAAPSA
jgi:hypothetical protein